MKAVILAAGEGMRMRPLTENTPKPMLTILGRPLLEYIIDELPFIIDEIILVIGYKGEQIREHFKNEYDGRKITYIEQIRRGGTADALHMCHAHLFDQKFLMLYADDFHGQKDLSRLLDYDLSVLVHHKDDPRQFGVVTIDDTGRVTNVVEKPEKPTSNFVLTGPALLDSRVFHYEAVRHMNGERYLAEIIGAMLKDHEVKAVNADTWISIGYPDDLKNAENFLRGDTVPQ